MQRLQDAGTAADSRRSGSSRSMVACAGPLATTSCKPRQARKGAAVAAKSCAGVWRVQVASIFHDVLRGFLP